MKRVWRSIFIVVCVLICGPSMGEELAVPLCPEMVFQVTDRGQEPETGSFVRLKVVSSPLNERCPLMGSSYRARGIITQARIRGSLFGGQADDVGKKELRNIRTLAGARIPGVTVLLLEGE